MAHRVMATYLLRNASTIEEITFDFIDSNKT